MDYSVGMDWHGRAGDNFLLKPTPLVKGVVNDHAVLELLVVIREIGGQTM
jgi:hypothetical protein